MTLLIVYVCIALGFSFLCSLLEATLLTITPAQIESAKAAKKPWAKRMQKLKAQIDAPLSAILTLNTIAHTMGATGAGTQYAKVYGDALGGVFAGGLTLAVLIFTEIIPKTLGARHTVFFAPFTTATLPILERILRPIVWACQGITRLISFGTVEGGLKHREELLAIANLGVEQGSLKARETNILKNALRLNQIEVSAIMTPRPVIFMMSETVSCNAFGTQEEGREFSRIPLYRDTPEHIDGFVLRADVLHACVSGSTKTLGELKRPIAAVEPKTKVDRLLNDLLQTQQHIALVQDHFGTVVGLVTLEDVLETLVGAEIMDENDTVLDLQKAARERWEAKQ